ncbi:MAG: POTRA domain-containing protein [Acidobacteriota bacterium]
MPSTLRRAALALTLFVVAGPSGARADTTVLPEELGRNIVSVGYTADGPVDEEEVARLIDLRVGQPLTEKATGNTIRSLFATGRFADVQVSAEPVEGGVAVVVHIARAYRVHPLRFSHKTIAREDLLRVLSFSEGSVYIPDEVEEGAAAIRRRLEAEGYLKSKVTADVTLDRVRFDARVVYRIEPGPAARVAPAFFDGETKPFTHDQLLARARLDPGDRYRESKARADAARMTELLHKELRLKGQVELIAAEPKEDGTIMPVYRIFVGPRVTFEATGLTPKKVASEVHALLEGQVFDEDLVLQYVENKRRDLQGSGYYRARVDYTLAESPDVLTVRVTIDRGPRLAIEKIVFTGNDSVPTRTLSEFMVTRKRGLPLVRPGRLVDDDLNEDVAAIAGYYQTHGWIAAKIDRPRVTEGSKANRLIVTIPVQEGPKAIVSSRRIEGVEHMDPAPLDRELLVKTGEPFNPALVRVDVTNLQNAYRDHGWGEAIVRGETRLAPGGASAEIVYLVDEGLRSFFGKTVIRGNSRTDTDRVRRLVTWQEGRPFSETDLNNTQRNLSRAGVFRRVELRPQPADPATRTRNVEVELQEGRPLSLLYGVGYQYSESASQNRSDPFLVGGVSYNNLFGRMLSAGFEGQISISGRYRAQLSFRDPYFLNRDITFTSFFFATREPIQDVELDRLGFVNELSHYFGKYLRAALRLEYQRIRPVNTENLSAEIEAADFPRFDQPIEEATIGPSAFYDRRDDVIDPHRGYYFSIGTKYAFPILSAKARFSKISGQAAYFHPFGRSVVAGSVRAGAIFPYGPSTIPVPIAERFFAGGDSTSRGFQRDLLGIPGQTVDYDTRATLHTGSGAGSCTGFSNAALYDCSAGPHIVGGNGFLAFNLEYRFPIFGDLGGTAFYDLGQVWKEFSDVRLALEGVAGLRQSFGVGLHYMTPIGPIRVEFGLPLKPRTIQYDVTRRDDTGRPIFPPLASGTVKEKGRLVVMIGYPF